MQDHVFSAQHITRIRSILENGEHSEQNLTNDEANDDENDLTTETEKRSGDQLQQLKNFKTKSPIAIDPSSDKLGFYNQFLMQNNMLGQNNTATTTENESNATNTNATPENFLNILRMQQNQQQQSQPGQSSNEENGLENNLLLQINTSDKTNTNTTNNNEILQQLYNYSQMSGKLIK